MREGRKENAAPTAAVAARLHTCTPIRLYAYTPIRLYACAARAGLSGKDAVVVMHATQL